MIVGTCYGIWMARRMKRYWPGADGLSGAERVTVVRAARRGERITDARLNALDYRTGIHAAAAEAKPVRWLLPVVLAVGVATAGWDAVYGSRGNAAASFIYLFLLLAELFWWPKKTRAASVQRRPRGPQPWMTDPWPLRRHQLTR